MQRVAGNRLEHSDGKESQKAPAVRPYAHLLPTLFDRLRDDAPLRKNEGPGEYTVSRQQMREIVQRDLAYLLNTANIEDLIDRESHPEAAASTVNFGIPALAGSYLSEGKWAHIEKLIRRAIADFEPRLVPDALQVMPLMKDSASHQYNVLLFEIRGLIRMDPYPMEFMVQSSVDLETNRMSIVSTRAR
ncbi:type VI secretion system baseplate subunit TssE [Collimonas silvisoli]|uniref:type VI secretion system baseplate subunit TssE n=1 Tax=Collimonas silvisoli TaxID=2825884 RepID=UPI001B8AEC10|nr:type VI secretion system baseplate subunit TssE [Collimonas silvisoli]